MAKTSRNIVGLLAAGLLLAAFSVQAAEEKAKGEKPEAKADRIQLAILLDTSNSMDGLINQARTQLWKIVNELATAKRNGKVPQLEVALYEYGKSSLSRDSGHIQQLVPLTDDLDKISEELFALQTQGGQEYCGQVISIATKELKWSGSGDDLKLIFICGNEPFTQGEVDYKKACGDAIAKGIIVNTIFCGARDEGIRTGWQQGAQLADGSFLHIDQNREVATIKTPFDEKLTKLGSEINKTYLAFGAENARKEVLERQVAQDRAAATTAPASAAERAAFKGTKQYKPGGGDLIDALADGQVKLGEIKDDELPEDLKKLSPKEREDYIAKKKEEREKIQKEIQELTEKRKEYIAKKRKEEAEAQGKDQTNTLDTAIIQAIRTQAKKKQFEVD